LTTKSCTPARCIDSIAHCIKGLPFTGSMGLGVWSLKGRMRSPRPAANNMAVAGREGVASMAREGFTERSVARASALAR
jgi:hypothetical protein